MPAYLPQGRLLRGSVEQWLAHPRIQQGLQCPNCWLKALAQACSGGTHLHQSVFIIIPTNSPLIAHRLSCVRSDQSSRSFGCQAPIKNLVYTDISGLNTCRKKAGSRMKKHWKILNENLLLLNTLLNLSSQVHLGLLMVTSDVMDQKHSLYCASMLTGQSVSSIRFSSSTVSRNIVIK